MVEGRDEVSGGEPLYVWPENEKPEAPATQQGVLVTWTKFSAQFERGWLAWIGGVRVGKIETAMTYDHGNWWCSLPSDDDNVEIAGDGTVAQCKAAITKLAEIWVEKARLVPEW